MPLESRTATQSHVLPFPEINLEHLLSQLLEAVLQAHVRIDQLAGEVAEQARQGSERAARTNSEHLVSELTSVVTQARKKLLDPTQEKLHRVSSLISQLESRILDVDRGYQKVRESQNEAVNAHLAQVDVHLHAHEARLDGVLSSAEKVLGDIDRELYAHREENAKTIHELVTQVERLMTLDPEKAITHLKSQLSKSLASLDTCQQNIQKDVAKLRESHDRKLGDLQTVVGTFGKDLASSTTKMQGALTVLSHQVQVLADRVSTQSDAIGSLERDNKVRLSTFFADLTSNFNKARDANHERDAFTSLQLLSLNRRFLILAVLGAGNVLMLLAILVALVYFG